MLMASSKAIVSLKILQHSLECNLREIHSVIMYHASQGKTSITRTPHSSKQTVDFYLTTNLTILPLQITQGIAVHGRHLDLMKHPFDVPHYNHLLSPKA